MSGGMFPNKRGSKLIYQPKSSIPMRATLPWLSNLVSQSNYVALLDSYTKNDVVTKVTTCNASSQGSSSKLEDIVSAQCKDDSGRAIGTGAIDVLVE